MNRDYITNITKFLKTAYRSCADGYGGCWHHKLDDQLYLVVAQGEEPGDVLAKIAYNCDDLQCDYELDWYEYLDKDTGDTTNTELGLCKGDLRKDAEWLYKQYKNILKGIKTGQLVKTIC